MRKFICLLLAVAMLLLAGCKQSAPDSDSIAKPEQSQETSTDSTTDITTEQGDTTDTTTENTEQTSTENTAETTDESTEPNKDESHGTQQPTPQTPTAASCSHTKTFVNGSSPANCTTDGYVGATICDDCGKTISDGYSVPATGHTKTEIRNQKDATTSSEGYTGDTVCVACNTVVSNGSSIPKLAKNQVTYTLPNGTTYTVDEDVNITDYTMKMHTWSVSHDNYAVEQEILRLCNEARLANGLPALRWNEDAYCFTKIRANECLQYYSHTRPNGNRWNTVYSDANILIDCSCAENIQSGGGIDGLTNEEYAEIMFQVWMDSSGHRANILNGNYRSVSIALVATIDSNGFTAYMAVQNFFGY